MRDTFFRQVMTALAVLVLGFAMSASGQVASAAAEPSGRQAAQGGPVRRLSVDEAVRLALEQNLSLQVQRIDPQVQDQGIVQAQASFAPRLSSVGVQLEPEIAQRQLPVGRRGRQAEVRLVHGQRHREPGVALGRQLQRGVGQLAKQQQQLVLGIQPGARIDADALLRPAAALRNFKIDSARQQLLVSKKNREISDVQLRQTVLATVRNVKTAYWDLSYAVSSLDVSRQSLDLARESLRNNRSRVEIGTMAPIDIIVAEAEVARREEAVIIAEATVARAEDRLRTLIYDPATPDFWAIRLRADRRAHVPGAADRRGRGRDHGDGQAHGPAAGEEEPREQRRDARGTTATSSCRRSTSRPTTR